MRKRILLGKPKPAVKPMKASPNRETLLLVEDDKILRKFLSNLATSEGYQVIEAGDGETALSISQEFIGTIHLLVTDLMMPTMNGKELADRLCALLPEIKVLFISGFSRSDFWPDDFCADQTDWLPKPFTPHQFIKKIRTILDSVPEP